MQRPPLQRIAEIARVSPATVSRVLNGRPGVTDTTRAKVTAALATLGFEDLPSPRPTRRGAVGLITGELDNPVFPELAHGIMRRLARHGLVATVGVAERNLSSEQRLVEEFCGVGVDGIVFVAGHHAEVGGDHSGYVRLAEQGVPFVLVNGADTGLDVPHAWVDERIAARLAVEHLASLGHRRIGCILGTNRYVPTERFSAGYADAMQDGGLTVPSDPIVHTSFTFEGGLASGRELIERGFTGLVCGNDLMALGAIAAARRAGHEVPGDVSVVGYDGTFISAVSDPPLTTLRQPFDDMGELVADALVSEIDHGRRFRQKFVFDPVLIVRGSTGTASDLATVLPASRSGRLTRELEPVSGSNAVADCARLQTVTWPTSTRSTTCRQWYCATGNSWSTRSTNRSRSTARWSPGSWPAESAGATCTPRNTSTGSPSRVWATRAPNGAGSIPNVTS